MKLPTKIYIFKRYLETQPFIVYPRICQADSVAHLASCSPSDGASDLAAIADTMRPT